MSEFIPDFLSASIDVSGSRPMKRDRTREGAGKSERSYIKHQYLRRAIMGQISAFAIRNPGRHIAIIDGNAGDGEGVSLPQLDLFDDPRSPSTAEMTADISSKFENVTVILCEQEKRKREALARKFPSAVIIKDNSLALSSIPPMCSYALWISDPCGPRGHGVGAMRELAGSLRSDFVIAVNEHSLKRIASTKADCWATSRDLYPLEMATPAWWTSRLQRARVSCTPLLNISGGFKCRILVAANVLSDAASRRPFEVVL